MSNRKQRRCRGNGLEPTDVNGQLALRTEYYKKRLATMVKGLFKVKCPIEWHKDYILNSLIYRGYILIADTPVGVIPCHGSLSGMNYWNYPTKAVIELPTIGSYEKTLGEDCEVVFLERMHRNVFFNFDELIRITAYRLAVCDACIDVNLFNSRVAYMIEAENKAQAETIKKMYDEITDGNPLCVYKANTLNPSGLNMFFNNVKQNYVANDILDTKRSIINELLTSVGINNANTDKKERLITTEVDSNNVELQVNTNVWNSNLKVCNKRVKRIFPGLEFKIKLKFDAKKIANEVNNIASGVGDNNESNRSNGNVQNTNEQSKR